MPVLQRFLQIKNVGEYVQSDNVLCQLFTRVKSV